MTSKEKREAVMAYCSGHGLCSQGHPTPDRRCPLRDFSGNCLTGTESIERNFKILCEAGVLSETEAVPGPVANPAPEFDPVNRPRHYNREGAMESIEEMELILGREAVMHFCLCNVLKYLLPGRLQERGGGSEEERLVHEEVQRAEGGGP